MANGNGFVQRAPLPPLNSPTINEADRASVYGAIGKELNNILNGATSYHADSVKKSSNDLRSELNDFISAVGSLKDAVNDPADIVGDAVRDLREFKKAFETGVGNDIETMWNDPKDERDNSIKLPDSIAPTTEDHNIIYVDPEAEGLFSAPNPLSPNQWPKNLKASIGSPDGVAAGRASSDNYPRLASRVVSSAPGSIGPLNPLRPPLTQQTGRPLGIFSGEPMPDYPLPPSIWGLPDNSNASGNNDQNWFTTPGGITSPAAGASGNARSSPMPAPQKSQPPAASTLMDYIKDLNQRNGGAPQAPMFDPAEPAATLPSGDPNSLGGLAGRIAALAGIDPENPDQPAPQPGGLLGLYLSGPR